MINDLIFDKIPRFFLFIYRLCCESFLFRTLGRAWRGLCRLCRQSLIGSALCEHRSEEGERQGSAIMRAIDAVVRGILWLIRRVIDALTFGSRSILLTRVLAKLRELYTFLDYEFFAGVCVLFIFLCPGDLWRNAYGLIIASALLFILLVLTAIGKREILSVRALGAAFVVFVFSTALSVFIAGDRSDALRVFVFFATAFILAIVLAADLRDPARLKKLLGFIYLAVICTAIYAFYQRLTGVAISASLTDVKTNSYMPGRVFSTFDNPNNYAEFLILTIPLCIAYCSMLKKSSAALIAWVLNALPLGALLMTYSRSGWISFALAVVIFVFLYNKKLFPALIVAGIIGFMLLPDTVLARIGTIGSTGDSSNKYRLYIWEGVLRMLKTNWLTGVGLGPASFRAVYVGVCNSLATPAPHSHMLYLEIWVEQGILGIVSYFAMLFSALRRGLIYLRYAQKNVRITMIACISSLTAILFASAVEYIWYYPRVMLTYFIVLGILYACISCARADRAAAASAAIKSFNDSEG